MPSVVGDGVSTLGSKIVSQFVQLGVFLVAARVLEAGEFGLYAYSSAIAILLVVVAEGGWGEYVMKAECTPEELDQIGTLAIISGTLVTLVGFAITAVVWLIFGHVWQAMLIGFFSCWFLPSSLSVVYDGLLVARGLLRKQAVIRIASELTGLCVTLAGLWIGWNVFSLVAGRLVTQLIGLLASAVVARWYPRLRLHRPFVRDVLEFSRHILANRLIIFLRSYAGTLAIGSFLGLTEAGYFRVAERIVAAFSELVGEPARMLAWTVFRKAATVTDADGKRRGEIGPAATTFMTLLMAASAPIYLGLSLVSHELVDIVLGEKWLPAAILVTLLAAKQVLLIPGYVTEALLSLSGNIKRMPAALLLNGAISIGLIVAFAPFGVEATAVGQCIAAVISFAISVHLQRHYGGLAWSRVIRDCAYVAIAVAAMAVAVYLLGYLADASALQRPSTLALQVILGGGIYVATLAMLQKMNGGAIAILVDSRR
jgi:O-antigen/teichoic acid export membrane protein